MMLANPGQWVSTKGGTEGKRMASFMVLTQPKALMFHGDLSLATSPCSKCQEGSEDTWSEPT